MQSSRVVQILFAVSGPLLALPQAELVVQIGHHALTSASFSPDGRQVLTTGDNVAVLWDRVTGHEIRVFIGENTVKAAVFSPSGKLILGADLNGVHVWEADSGREVKRFESESQNVSSAAISANGKRILTGHEDGTARLWDVGSGKQILHIGTLENSRAILPASVAFSPDGKLLLTGTRKTVQLWDAVSGREVRRFEGHTYPINCVAFSQDGRFVLSGSNDRTARMWETATGKEIRRFEIPRRVSVSAGVLSVAFSPDGTKILTGSEDQTTRLWDVASGRQVFIIPAETQKLKIDYSTGQTTGFDTVEGHRSAVVSVAFSPDGRFLLTGEQFQMARLWDAATGKQMQLFQGSVLADRELSSFLAFSPDGRQLWTGGPHVWDMAAGKEIRRPKGQAISKMALSPDSLKLAGLFLNQLLLFDNATGTPILKFENPPKPDSSVVDMYRSDLETIVYSPTRPQVLTATRADEVDLWDTTTGRRVLQFRGHQQEVARIGGVPPQGIRSAVFSPDGSQVATAGTDRIVRLWDTASGRETMTFQARNTPERAGAKYDFWNLTSRVEQMALAFSPDGRNLASCGSDSAVRIWDKATGKQIQRLYSPGQYCNALTFSPDGRHLLTASWEGPIHLWDPVSGRETFRSTVLSARPETIAFSPTEQVIASAHADGTIRLWELAGDQLRLLATLVSYPAGWAVVDPQGRFDTDVLDGHSPLHWIVSDEPFRPLPLEIFMRQYYTPKLLPKLLSREKLPNVPNIADLNRVQPHIAQPAIEAEPGKPDFVRIRVKVARQNDGKRSSGVQDLRLFRNGRMVRYEEGHLEEGDHAFDGIRLPHEKSVEFTAYAFNSDLVKSDTVRAVWERRDSQIKPSPRTFVLNIGVNRSRGAGCDLRYAVNDAVGLRDVLERTRLPLATVDLLVSDDAHPLGATKQSILEALKRISRQATPDDIFLMSFSGHGYTSSQGLFYILPSDFVGSCHGIDEQHALSSAISSDELTAWLRPIDAGEMVMILDACYSAASVESANFKPGPMGSKGLGQLSYDKQIRILTASQSVQAAAEWDSLKMGLLTHVLVREGLEKDQADWQPRDGKIWLREWLNFAVDGVPRLYGSGNANRGVKLPDRPRVTSYENPNWQVPVLFDFTAKDNQGTMLK